MGISVVGSAGVDGLSVSLPAGTTTDDVVVGSIANNTLNGTSVTNSWSTSGYDANVQFDLNNTEFDNVNLKVAYKVQGGTPDSTMVINTPDPAYDRTILAYVFRGVDTTTPLDVATQTALGGQNDNRPDPPSITPNTDGAAIYIVGATTDDITTAAPTNYSNYDEALHSEGGTDDIGHYVASRILATAALENPGIFDAGGGSSSTWIAATLAFKPAFLDAFTAGGEQVSSFSHAGAASGVKGVLVAIVDANESSDLVSGVTYGGTSLNEVSGSPFAGVAGGYNSMIHLYFLGSGLESLQGTRTVSITTSQTDDDWQAYCLTFTREGDVEVHATAQRDYDPPTTGEAIETTIGLGGNECFVGFAAASDAPSTISIVTKAGFTDQNTTDVGFDLTLLHTYDTIGTADVTAGYSNSGGNDSPGHVVAFAIKDASGASVQAGAGAAAGTATAAGVAAMTAAAAGAAAGIATTSGLATAIIEAAGAAAGAATGAGSGAKIAAGAGAAAAVASASGIAAAIAAAAGGASGQAVAAAAAGATAEAVGAAMAGASAAGAGEATAAAAGAAAGQAAANGIASAIAAGIGVAAGSATVTGIGEELGAGIESGAGSAGGAATASGIASAIAAGAAAAAGVAGAGGTGTALTPAAGAAAGQAAANGIASAIAAAVGQALGVAGASAAGAATAEAIGQAVAAAVAAAVGLEVGADDAQIIEDALFDRLVAVAAVTDLVGQRIYYRGSVPQNPTYPYIVFRREQTGVYPGFNATTGVESTRFRFDVIARQKLTAGGVTGAVEVAAALATALQRFRGTVGAITVQDIELEDEGDGRSERDEGPAGEGLARREQRYRAHWEAA